MHCPWDDDFGAARNAALAACNGRWILVLDADEVLAPGGADAIREAVQDATLDCGMLALHNARTLVRDLRLHGAPVFDRFRGKQDGTLWYYRGCHQALRSDWSHYMLDHLDREVREMHALAGAKRKI